MQSLNDLKFFVVDDDPFYRMLYRQHLLNMGYKNNILFENGEDCINGISACPDVVLLDYNMMPFNGLEVIQRIRISNPDIFLLLISSQQDPSVISDAISLGAFDYIVKGDKDLEMISSSIKRIIAAKQMSNAGQHYA